ncbi:hypothetical protein GGS23DRAFT_362499 [Durotheca rogersii]|uniref:uncharacterized protein n=1 Tax=Durotheca rogersii TaxID=419775 RepID=UPI00221E8B4A|nr:uncharacterized protein GGS23DRAFT_362499 [Durotheca rogersii]KAI5865962.1 hypothetical protein GGS23DRAFT_362499 [Durotheca rogersii]
MAIAFNPKRRLLRPLVIGMSLSRLHSLTKCVAPGLLDQMKTNQGGIKGAWRGHAWQPETVAKSVSPNPPTTSSLFEYFPEKRFRVIPGLQLPSLINNEPSLDFFDVGSCVDVITRPEAFATTQGPSLRSFMDHQYFTSLWQFLTRSYALGGLRFNMEIAVVGVLLSLKGEGGIDMTGNPTFAAVARFLLLNTTGDSTISRDRITAVVNGRHKYTQSSLGSGSILSPGSCTWRRGFRIGLERQIRISPIAGERRTIEQWAIQALGKDRVSRRNVLIVRNVDETLRYKFKTKKDELKAKLKAKLKGKKTKLKAMLHIGSSKCPNGYTNPQILTPFARFQARCGTRGRQPNTGTHLK